MLTTTHLVADKAWLILKALSAFGTHAKFNTHVFLLGAGRADQVYKILRLENWRGAGPIGIQLVEHL